jgi:hypothetical protein
MEHFTLFRDVIAYVALAGGAILMLLSRVKNENLKDLKERVEILEKERTYAHEQHLENQKAISNLEGQLKTYKEIPLTKIADSLESLAVSNNEIRDTIKNSGGMLVQTKDKNPLAVKEKK